METTTKTPEEILKLKHSWICDPCWDIEHTEGFEAHKEELLAYRLEIEKEQNDRYQKKLIQKAEKMGIPDNLVLAEYITKLEMNIDFQFERIEKLESRFNK